MNDGSTDSTLDQLKAFVRDWANARIIDLVQNSGQGAALMAGIKNCRGQKIILPKAEMHRLEAGHFAVEDCLDYISEHMHRFYDERVAARDKH